MLTAIGIDDYSPLHRLRAAEKQAEADRSTITELENRLAAVEAEKGVVTDLCRYWAAEMGRDYAEELEFWRDYQAAQ